MTGKTFTRRAGAAVVALAVSAGLAGGGMAGPVSLLTDSTFRTDRVAFIPMDRVETDDDRPGGPSLFAMLDGRGLWQPTARAGLGIGAAASDFAGTLAERAGRLRDVIAKAEAGAKGYDAVQHGARVPPPDRPTRMTIAQIYAWIDATPGQPHAIGRYQFIPKTLRALVEALEIDPNHRFSQGVQNRLADRLLAEAGMHAFDAGTLSRDRFMLNLARIWAGLPTSTGRSYYEGYAGNKATMSWSAFDTAMAEIFPAGAAAPDR